jgi:tetratricopeptide (TPR) repeat protein
MSDDTITSLLGSFAEVLADPGGYEPNELEALSKDAPAPLPSFAKAVLSSDGGLLLKTIEELAALASRENSFNAWFNLGVLAHRLFFTQAAICYYERSLELADAQKDEKNAAKALNNLGSLYAEGEDWDRASEHYRRGLKQLEKEGDLQAALPLLKNLGDVHRMCDELDQALKCYEKALTATDGGTNTIEVLNKLGKLHQLKGDSSKALEFYQKSLTESERIGTVLPSTIDEA